MLDKTV